MTISPERQDLIDELGERLGELATLPDAARAEAWVSGLVGELREEAVAGGDSLEELLDAVLAAGPPAAAHVCAEMLARSPLGPRSVATDGDLPEWIDEIGDSRCVEAFELTTPDAVTTVLVYGDDERHVLCVEAGTELIDIQVGPDELLAGVAALGASATMTPVRVDEAESRARAVLAEGSVGEPTTGIVQNGFLAEWRLGVVVPVVRDERRRVTRERDTEADAAALRTLDAAVGPAADPPLDAIREVAQRIRGTPAADDEVLLAAAGCDALPDDDADLVVAFAAAYIVAADLRHHDRAEQDRLDSLEWADWLGVVIGAARGGAGTGLSPPRLVQLVNRCPEVTSSIPAAHADDVAEAFALTLHAWERAGAIDGEGFLTDLGVWLLPAAARWAWS